MSQSESVENRIPAIVLAGAPADPEVTARYAITYQAEIPVLGKTMAQRVVDALNAAYRVSSVCVVGNIDCEGAAARVSPAGSFIENLLLGTKACDPGDQGRLLLSTSDIPMLTSEAVDDFVARCDAVPADLCYAIVSKQDMEARFHGMRRTYARLAEGTFTGGNIVVMKKDLVLRNEQLIRKAYSARKSKFQLAKMIGLPMLVRVLLAQKVWAGAVSLPALERKVGDILKANVKAVQTSYAEIGADIDDLSQVHFAESALQSRSGAAGRMGE